MSGKIGPPSRRLAQFLLEDPDACLYHDEPIYRDGILVGRVASADFGHTVDRPVALGYVDAAAVGGSGEVVGATAHYVTSDLDEGPIIEQATARIDHSLSPADVAALGRDTECLALARAVRWHVQRRVFLDGRRTVVFQ